MTTPYMRVWNGSSLLVRRQRPATPPPATGLVLHVLLALTSEISEKLSMSGFCSKALWLYTVPLHM